MISKRLMMAVVVFILVAFKGEKITKTAVLNEARRVGVAYPEITTKIAILESGLKNNNLFGFRTNVKYFKYETWQQSVAYYKKWEDKNYGFHLSKYHSRDTQKRCDYYHFLWARGYVDGKPFSNKGAEYNRKLKKIKL